MNLILDTNVFYDLGSGAINIADCVRPGDELYFSPITILELAGKWSDRVHADRKAAAQAIIDCRAKELLDPECHLTDLFGYELSERPFSFMQAAIAMAGSRTLDELQQGVPDYSARLIRRVVVPMAATWRDAAESKWVDDILAIMQQNIPRFGTWLKSNPRGSSVPKLRRQDREVLIERSKTNDWFADLLLACQDRAFFKANRGAALIPTRETVKRLSAAIDHIDCYCCVYTQYLIRCLTEGALPKPNDGWDLEFFLYAVDDDHVIVTSDEMWVKLAKKAGYGCRIRSPKLFTNNS